MSGAAPRSGSGRAADRLVRLALLVYPPGFRRRFGDSILETFAARRQELGRAGPLAEGRFLMRTLANLVWEGLRERRHPALDRPQRARAGARPRAALHWLETLWQELRYGARGFRLNPGFTTLAVLTLALGIGSVAVLYSVIDNVLLDPFPYTDSRRMVDVFVVDAQRPGGGRGPFPAPEFLDYQRQSTVFEDVAGAIDERMTYRTAQGTELLAVIWLTPNSFDFLGVRPLLGRGIAPSDGAPDAPPVAVLSHQLWLSHFGGDPAALGRTIVLDDQPRTIVGVMPPRFTWHVGDVWIPGALEHSDPRSRGHRRWFQARLKPGVTIEQAEAELEVIAKGRARAHPDRYPEQFRMEVITVIDWVVGRFRGVLYTLLAAVGLLLLIACCNVANMLLARATAREREMSIRAALGAGRGRILRQLLAESLLLALGGAAAGCALAYGGIAAVVRFMPRQGIPYETEISLDGRVLLFSLLTAVLAAVLFGLAPALYSIRRDLVLGLSSAARGAGGGFRHGGVRNGLVVAEIALALVLLLSAGVVMRSFLAMVHADLGVDPTAVARAGLAFPDGQYETPAQRYRFLQPVLARLRSLPGVVAAAAMAPANPLSGFRSELEVRGVARAGPSDGVFQLCGEQCLVVADRPLLRGRGFSPEDVHGARRVAVVNRALADVYLEGRSPLGRTVRIVALEEAAEGLASAEFEIVGVVGDVRNQGPRDEPLPHVYVPYTVAAWADGIVARTSADPSALVAAMQRGVWDADPGVIVLGAATLEELLSWRYAQPRFSLIVLTAFAGTGMLLMSIGIYSVLAFTVSRQSQEIAVRMALGADRRDVLGVVLNLGARLIGLGVALGLLASVGASRILSSQLGHQLMDPSSYDPRASALALVVVLATGLIACGLPGLRAAHVDPMQALRHD